MRFRNLRNWNSPENSSSLLFFCQMFEEAFFDFSLDTYKPSAMNSSLLCEEALLVIDAVKKGQIKDPNIIHVIDELCDSLEKDIVVKNLIDISLKDFIAILKNPKKSTEEKETTIEVLLSYINLGKYKSKNESLLIHHIMNDGDKRTIRNLARSYGTTLLNFNYSEKFIYDSILNFFYHGGNKIKGNESINDFIYIFSHEPDNYCFIYKGSHLYSGLDEAAKVLKISISETFPEVDGVTISDDTKNLLSKTDGIYVKVDNINASDLNSAKKSADYTLKTFGTIFSLFHHKE